MVHQSIELGSSRARTAPQDRTHLADPTTMLTAKGHWHPVERTLLQVAKKKERKGAPSKEDDGKLQKKRNRKDTRTSTEATTSSLTDCWMRTLGMTAGGSSNSAPVLGS